MTFRHSSRNRPLKLSMYAFVSGFSRVREIQLHVTAPRPVFECPGDKFRTMVDRDRQRRSPWCRDTIERGGHVASLEREAWLNQGTESSELIYHGEHANRPPVEELIVDEIHAPALDRTRGARNNPAMQTHVFAPWNSHAHLQAFQLIRAMNALEVHMPAFAPQQHRDASIAETRTGVRDIPDPQLQSGEVLLRAAAGSTLRAKTAQAGTRARC